jgi:hypothetical protein
LTFRLENLDPREDAKLGEIAGAAYFAQTSGSKEATLNSCNFFWVRGDDGPGGKWQGVRFHWSAATPADKVAARLNLDAPPTVDDTFGVKHGSVLYENAMKADKGMHIVKVECGDDVKAFFEQVIAKALK